jgi:hypothetical protein
MAESLIFGTPPRGALGDRRVPAGLFSMADPGSNFNVNDAMNCFLGSGQEISIHVTHVAGNC